MNMRFLVKVLYAPPGAVHLHLKLSRLTHNIEKLWFFEIWYFLQHFLILSRWCILCMWFFLYMLYFWVIQSIDLRSIVTRFFHFLFINLKKDLNILEVFQLLVASVKISFRFKISRLKNLWMFLIFEQNSIERS